MEKIWFKDLEGDEVKDETKGFSSLNALMGAVLENYKDKVLKDLPETNDNE